MSKIKRVSLSIILSMAISVASTLGFSVGFNASAASFSDINTESVFLKQQTPVTCTLSSAAMLLRRTAIIAGYSDWREITEANIRSVGWVDGLGLLWNFTYRNLKIGHGYFSGTSTKADMIDLLDKYPQGIVIYNGGNQGQSHAVFLTDYDEDADVFYAADPASTAPKGRVKLTETTIRGGSQNEQIANLTSYWIVVSPEIKLVNGVYSATDFNVDPAVGNGEQGGYDPKSDTDAYNASEKSVGAYYVVTDDAANGASLRYYPSGSSGRVRYIEKGTILYIESVGQNNFGASWYKSRDGYYIYGGNACAFSSYSAEIKKFKNTSVSADDTYVVSSVSDNKAALRIEPSEGNNILAYIQNGKYLHIVASGVNSAGASWLMTDDGYYIKKSETKLISAGKLPNSDFAGDLLSLSGKYSSTPIQDRFDNDFTPAEYIITASFLNMRRSPVDGEVIVSIPKNAQVTVADVLSGWGKADYNGRTGWISLEYAEKIIEERKPLAVKSATLNTVNAETGETVICTVTVSDDVSCSYRFSVCNDKGLVVYENKSFDSSAVLTYKTQAAGEYYFTVEIRDADGRTAVGYSGNFSVHNKLQLASVASDTDDVAKAFEPITWTVSTVSTSSNAKFCYTLFCDNEAIDSVELNTAEYTFTPETEGTYYLTVTLTDPFSSSEPVVSEAIRVYRPLSIDAITLSSTAVRENQNVECVITASGGLGTYSYCFSLFENTTLVKNGAFQASNTESFTLTKAGTYSIFCAVADSSGLIVSTFSAPILVIDYMLGDVNGDGKITAADARVVLRHSAGIKKISAEALIAADVNKDRKVNAADARAILRCAANIEKFE